MEIGLAETDNMIELDTYQTVGVGMRILKANDVVNKVNSVWKMILGWIRH